MTRRRPSTRRRAMSLLEVLTASALMATMMASTVVVLRGSYAAWQAHEADMERNESAHAVLRHVTRQLRQASSVTAWPSSGATSTGLSLYTPSGDLCEWTYDSATGLVSFAVNGNASLLADNIDSLLFRAFEADGVSPANPSDNIDASDIRLVRCEVTMAQPLSSAPTRTVSCTGWIRIQQL